MLDIIKFIVIQVKDIYTTDDCYYTCITVAILIGYNNTVY